jgi:hypothetical protein
MDFSEQASATDHLESALSTLSPITQQVGAEDELRAVDGHPEKKDSHASGDESRLRSDSNRSNPETETGVIVYNKKQWNILGISEDKVTLQMRKADGSATSMKKKVLLKNLTDGQRAAVEDAQSQLPQAVEPVRQSKSIIQAAGALRSRGGRAAQRGSPQGVAADGSNGSSDQNGAGATLWAA